MVTMNQDYTQYTIDNYILKIIGVFKYDTKFINKALLSDYTEIEYDEELIKDYKDYFYPDFRKQFFSNDKKRHHILIKKNIDKTPLELFILNRKKEISKECSIILDESRLDLMDDGFGLFTLDIKLNSNTPTLSEFSDAAFLARGFDTLIKHQKFNKWHEYIESEVLLENFTRGNSIQIDEYSGSKYKLFMVLNVPDAKGNHTISNILFDMGTLARVGSAVATTYDSMDKNYIEQLVKSNSISVYDNWKGLALLDTFTVVGNGIGMFVYNNYYYGIYLYSLFIKYSLFKFNYEIADLDEDRRSQFQDFLTKYYYSFISYNFLPSEIFNRLKISLDIDRELKLMNEKIELVGRQIQEEQQDRTNKILGIVTVLSSLSSAQPVYDYLLIGQKYLEWEVALYWTVAIVLTVIIGSAVGFYVFGKKILKWINKRKK
jgi:hypothetical protein